MLLTDLFEQWTTNTSECPATADHRRCAMDWCLWAVGNIAVSDFTHKAAMKMRSAMATRLAASSVESYIKAFKPVLNFAVLDKQLERNPFPDLKKLKVRETEIKVYTRSEATQLVLACSRLTSDWSRGLWRLRLLLALSCALRRGELLNLRAEDIDYDRRVIRIRHHDESDLCWDWDTKSRRDREVPLTSVLEPEIRRMDAALKASNEALPGHPYLCLSPRRYRRCQELRRAGQWNYDLGRTPDQNMSNAFRRLCNRAAVENKGLHAMRATCLTMWADEMSVHRVAALAGHSDITVTAKYYLHVGNDTCQKAAEATDQVMRSIAFAS